MRWWRLIFLLILFGVSVAAGQLTHTEATGSYSGLFIGYESPREMKASAGTGRLKRTAMVSTLTLMYPGKVFGFGIEAPHYRSTTRTGGGAGADYRHLYLGDVRLVAKYQFGVYRKYRLFGRERLLNMALSLIGKLKLPTAASDRLRIDGALLPVRLQPGTGSTDLTLGFVFHTDTPKRFRIHSHLTVTAPLSYGDFRPGQSMHFTVSYILARMGWKSRYYPFLGLKGWVKAADRMNGAVVSHTGGYHFYLTPGIRTSWWYFSDPRMFLMLEAGLPIKISETAATQSPSFGFYLGTRIFFR